MVKVVSIRAPVALRAVAVCARRRVPDYSSRRSGGEGENSRRRFNAGGGSPQRQSYDSPSQSYDNPQTQSYDSPSLNGRQPVRNVRRKSPDYSARRAGGEGENSRRRYSADLNRPRQSYDAPQQQSPQSSWDQPRSSSGPNRNIRRKTPDYSARRAGGEGENSRRRYSADLGRNSGSYDAPQQQQQQSQSSWDQPRSSSGPNRNIRRKTPDYSARRAGGEGENSRRRYSADLNRPQSQGSYDRPQSQSYDSGSSGSNGRAPLRNIRRKTPDYSARRSGGEGENSRRRYSEDMNRPTSSYDSQSQSTPAPVVDNRRSPNRNIRRKSVDYSSRRSGGEGENSRRRFAVRG